MTMLGRIALLLPKTTSVNLQIVIVILAGTLFTLAAPMIIHAVSMLFSAGELKIGSLFTSAVLSFIAAHLWMLKSWSRKVMKFVIGVSIVIGIGGIFNPFYDMDYRAAHAGNSPDWVALAAIVGPLVALGLWCFYILDKFKAEFK